MKYQYFLAIFYYFKRFNLFAEEILNNNIRHACHISTSRLGLKEILEYICSKFHKNMLNMHYYWHLLSCETFCKTGITEYSLKNFFPSWLTWQTYLRVTTQEHQVTDDFIGRPKHLHSRNKRCVAAFSIMKPKLREQFQSTK